MGAVPPVSVGEAVGLLGGSPRQPIDAVHDDHNDSGQDREQERDVVVATVDVRDGRARAECDRDGVEGQTDCTKRSDGSERVGSWR